MLDTYDIKIKFDCQSLKSTHLSFVCVNQTLAKSSDAKKMYNHRAFLNREPFSLLRYITKMVALRLKA